MILERERERERKEGEMSFFDFFPRDLLPPPQTLTALFTRLEKSVRRLREAVHQMGKIPPARLGNEGEGLARCPEEDGDGQGLRRLGARRPGVRARGEEAAGGALRKGGRGAPMASCSGGGRGGAGAGEEQVPGGTAGHRRVQLDKGSLLSAGEFVFVRDEQGVGLAGVAVAPRLLRSEEAAEQGAELGRSPRREERFRWRVAVKHR